MEMKKIFASFLICGALSLGSLPAHADDLPGPLGGIAKTIGDTVGGLLGDVEDCLSGGSGCSGG